MARILSGTEVARDMTEAQIAQREALFARGIVPTLAVVRVGERASDLAYQRALTKRADRIGIRVQICALPEEVSEAAMQEAIEALNRDDAVHGVLAFRPLPGVLDAVLVGTLLPKKDLDGITDVSLSSVFAGSHRGYAPCTAEACMRMLDHYGIDCAGKRAVVVGRSLVVGRPLAMLLLERNATVTVCHTKTRNLPAVCREADLVIAAAGRANLLGRDCFRPGQTVLDVGVNTAQDGRITGDVCFSEALDIVDAVSPVPGGVGAVTTAVLMEHVLSAAN